MKKNLFVLPIFGMLFTSCEKDENIEDLKEPQSQQKSLMMSGFHLETIDNGSDGQILFFDSAEAYYNVQENLFNQPNAYIDSYQDQIPTDLNDDQLEEYLNGINYNEDAIYEGFEQSLGFNSFRVKLNNDIDLWLDIQTNPDMMINEENDPDNNTLVLESDRALYNMGGEVVVLDSLQNPVIYKAFDWGHLAVENFDTDVIKIINTENLKTIEDIQLRFTGKSNIKFKIDNPFPVGNCSQGNIKNKQHFYSPNNKHNVKSIIKNKKALFPGNGYPDRLIIKTKGYLWKRGKWRNRAVWLVSGFTSKKNQGNHSITWWNTGCTGTGQTQLFPARTKCVAKYEYDGGNPKGSNIVYIDNTLYAYHGQGTFTFTVDFYPGHEAYTITY